MLSPINISVNWLGIIFFLNDQMYIYVFTLSVLFVVSEY
jgi:hypothetical protein